MKNKEQDMIIHNDEVNEILSDTPAWILQWGISVVFILIITGVTLSYFIQYPDVLAAEITVTTTNPPVTLLSRSNGKLSHLLVKEKQHVKKGQTIGVVENTANYSDVLTLLDAALSALEQIKKADTLLCFTLQENLKTGEITPAYLQVLKSIKDTRLYFEISSCNKQIMLLQQDLGNYNLLIGKYDKQLQINSEQLKLYENDYLRDKKLYDEKAISAREFENKKKEYLNALNSNEQVKISNSNVLIQINGIEKSILQLQLQKFQEQNRLKNELQLNLKTLVSEINQWKQQYIIESPIEGRISFSNIWVINQNLKAGDELFTVVSNDKQEFVGKCSVPILNSGKLMVGQKVNIKLANYPYYEYGMLTGKVVAVSEVPNKDLYTVDVKLVNGLTSSHQITLAYRENMKGKAEIVTNQMSVMDRIFMNIRKLLNRKSKAR